MNGTTLTKADNSSVIIEQDVIPDKSWEGLLSILKRSRRISIDDAFSEGVTKKLVEMYTHKESVTVVTTRLRSEILVFCFASISMKSLFISINKEEKDPINARSLIYHLYQTPSRIYHLRNYDNYIVQPNLAYNQYIAIL